MVRDRLVGASARAGRHGRAGRWGRLRTAVACAFVALLAPRAARAQEHCPAPREDGSTEAPGELGPRPVDAPRSVRVETDEAYLGCHPSERGLACDALSVVSLRNTSAAPAGVWISLPGQARGASVGDEPLLVSRDPDCRQRAYLSFAPRSEQRLSLRYSFRAEPEVQSALELVRSALEVRHPLLGTRASDVRIANVSLSTTRSDLWGSVHARSVRISLPGGFTPVLLGARPDRPREGGTRLACATGRLRPVLDAEEDAAPRDSALGRKGSTFCSGRVRLLVRAEPTRSVYAGGPTVGAAWFARTQSLRARAGYELALFDPSLVLLSVFGESDARRDLLFVPAIGTATSKRTVMPSLGMRLAMPVRVRPETTVGARLEGTLSYPVGLVGVGASIGADLDRGRAGLVAELAIGF